MILSNWEAANLKSSAVVLAQFMGDWFCVNHSHNGYTLSQYQECDLELVSQKEFGSLEEAVQEVKKRVNSWLDDLVTA